MALDKTAPSTLIRVSEHHQVLDKTVPSTLIRVTKHQDLIQALGDGLTDIYQKIFSEPPYYELFSNTEVQYIFTKYFFLAGVGVSQNIEAYFLGLGKASIIRNAFLIAALFGFAPLAGLAWHFQSNHILWLAMSMFMVGRVAILSFQLPKTFSSNVEVDTNRALS